MSIEKDRAAIDRIDLDILALLNERASLAISIAHEKRQAASEQFSPARERQIFDRLLAQNKGPLPDAGLISIYREVIAVHRLLTRPLRVAYLGPAGTFSHVAALRKFGGLSELRAVDSIPETFSEVEKDAADYGIAPIENSLGGVVPYTLDVLADTSLRVCAELYVDIELHLLANCPLEQVTRVYSMPQPLAQARIWLKTNLPRAELVEVSSTARAAQVAGQEPGAAAIGTTLAAELYGLGVVVEHVEDQADNRTRFIVVGRHDSPPSGRDKTSIIFSVRHQSGALYRALGALNEHGINMTLIESRPTRKRPWEYLFYVDFQGHAADPNVARALEALAQECLQVRVMGSYPESE